jgi:hypothetical protein
MHEDESLILEEGRGLVLRACECGDKSCAARHRLEAWAPSVCSLWAFLASATKGPKLPNVPAVASFAEQSMYGAMLAAAGDPRIRYGRVEHKKCSRDDHLYEGEACTECTQPFDETCDERVIVKALIVDGAQPPQYSPEKRVRCRTCGNLVLYPDLPDLRAAIACPSCGKPYVGKRLSRIVGNRAYREVLGALRAVIRDRLSHPECVNCGAQVPEMKESWCPICRASGVSDPKGLCSLSADPTRVWVRTHARVENDAAALDRDGIVVKSAPDELDEDDT